MAAILNIQDSGLSVYLRIWS